MKIENLIFYMQKMIRKYIMHIFMYVLHPFPLKYDFHDGKHFVLFFILLLASRHSVLHEYLLFNVSEKRSWLVQHLNGERSALRCSRVGKHWFAISLPCPLTSGHPVSSPYTKNPGNMCSFWLFHLVIFQLFLQTLSCPAFIRALSTG